MSCLTCLRDPKGGDVKWLAGYGVGVQRSGQSCRDKFEVISLRIFKSWELVRSPREKDGEIGKKPGPAPQEP